MYLMLVIMEGNGESDVEGMAHENWGCKSVELLVVKRNFPHLQLLSQDYPTSECGLWPGLDLEETEFHLSLS